MDSNLWYPTAELRIVDRDLTVPFGDPLFGFTIINGQMTRRVRMRILQQKWRSKTADAAEWRDVPVEEETRG